MGTFRISPNNVTSTLPIGAFKMCLVRKIQNAPKQCFCSVPGWYIQNLLVLSTTMYWVRQTSGKLPEHCKNIGKTGNITSSFKMFLVFPVSLQCSCSVPDVCRTWYIAVDGTSTFWIYQPRTLQKHCLGAFWIFLTRNIVMRRSSTSRLLSLGKFWMYPLIT